MPHLIQSTTHFKAVLRGLLLACCLLWSGLNLLAQEAGNPLEINGQVQIPAGVTLPPEGLDVVLIKFVLNDAGDVVPAGPVARTKSDSDGQFRFENPPRDERAGYRLGTRYEGNLYSSEVFFMRPEQLQITVDISLPSTSFETDSLEFVESSLFLESNIDQLVVTEVISIRNATENNILTTETPLLLELPGSQENFRVLEDGPETYQQEGSQLRWTRNFPPGDTQLIFQYTLSTFLGSYTLTKRYPHPLDRVSIFTPAKRLEVRSTQVSFQGSQTFGEVEFLSWRAQASDVSQLELRISNIPVDSRNYAFVGLAVFLTLLLAVGWFFWRRLPRTALAQR